MGTTLDIVNEWASDSEEKQTILKTRSGWALRLLNQAQLRYADKSELIRGSWTPTITSTGSIAIPTDFIREYPDSVKYSSTSTVNPPLIKIDYWKAVNINFTGATTHYSIFNGTFYVWAAGALTPSVTYVKKPAILTTFTSTDLEIPTEFQCNLIPYLDIFWEKSKGKLSLGDQLILLKEFDNQAGLDGLKLRTRQDDIPRTRSVRLG